MRSLGLAANGNWQYGPVGGETREWIKSCKGKTGTGWERSLEQDAWREDGYWDGEFGEVRIGLLGKENGIRSLRTGSGCQFCKYL